MMLLIAILSLASGPLNYIALRKRWFPYYNYLVDRYLLREDIVWRQGQGIPRWVSDAMGDGDFEVRELKPKDE